MTGTLSYTQRMERGQSYRRGTSAIRPAAIGIESGILGIFGGSRA